MVVVIFKNIPEQVPPSSSSTNRLNLNSTQKMEAVGCSQMLVITRLHGVINQNNTTYVSAALKTWNLKYNFLYVVVLHESGAWFVALRKEQVCIMRVF
jgi:hypothetical protein